MWIIYHPGSWVWVLRRRRRLWPCATGDLWHHCLSAYMLRNIANPTVDCSCHTSGGLPWSINQPGNGLALLVPCDCSSAPSLSLEEETVARRRSRGSSGIWGTFYWLRADLRLSVRWVMACSCYFTTCLCVCLFFLPSVIQKTLRKARSWADMGGSLQCRAKTQELKIKRHQSKT